MILSSITGQLALTKNCQMNIYIGEVESIDNKEHPLKNYEGSRLEIGQKIYANDEIPEIIYIKYENGYARFSPSYSE